MIPRVLPLLFLILIAIPAVAQEAVPQVVEGVPGTAAPAAVEAAPLLPAVESTAGQPATVEAGTDTGAGFDAETGTETGSGTIVIADPAPMVEPESLPVEEVEPPPAAEPVAVVVPAQGPESIQAEDRERSIKILIAAIVVIAAMSALIVLVIRRGRELRSVGQAYVAEAYLNDLHGSTPQAAYQLGSKPVMLGRVAGKDTEHVDYIVIPQSTIGRRHALIEYKDFAYWIMDQGSINGTFVNDKAVNSEIRLKHGDRVRLHKYQFEFVMPDVGETGKTIVSKTQFAARSAEQEAQAAQKAAASREEVEQLGNLSVTDEHSIDRQQPAGGEPETLIRSGGGDAGAERGAAIDETLLPGSDSGVLHPHADDETLLPGGGLGDDADAVPESEDETLMPGSGSGSSGSGGNEKKGGHDESRDEFIDITRSDKDAGR